MSESKAANLTSPEEIVSYGIGRQMGEQLMSNTFGGCSIEHVQIGLADAFNNVANPIDLEAMQQAYDVIRAKMDEELKAEAEKNLEEGKNFLAENAKKDGIVTLESGLQYEIVQAGEGDKPAATDTVQTHYHGTFIDGKVFDSSIERGQPAEFPVNGVIKGWVEALQLMPVGSKWRLYIPSDLAYGAQGSQGGIPPHSTLIFDIELIEIK